MTGSCAFETFEATSRIDVKPSLRIARCTSQWGGFQLFPPLAAIANLGHSGHS
jgi:hypothetical protein